MDLSRTGFRFARVLGVRVRGVLLGSVGSLMESTKSKELSDPKDVPICHYVRPQETKLPATTIKTLTPNWDSSISPNAQNLSQLSEFSTNDGRDETKQDPNDSRSQILRQNSLRCFACFDRRHCQTNFGGIDSKDYDHEWFDGDTFNH